MDKTEYITPHHHKLTIAIPIYNDDKYLEQTIRSCLAEAGTIILHDNASTDQSSDICARYANQYAHVKHIRLEENIGAFENFKRSLFSCNTEYFCWVGSHDMLEPNYSEPIIKALESSPEAVLAVGKIQHIDESGARLGHPTHSQWASDLNASSPLVRVSNFALKLRDCFMWYGIYRTAAARKAWLDIAALGHDRVMLLRIAALGSVLYVPDSTFLARDFPVTRDKKQDRNRRAVILGHEKAAPLINDNTIRNKLIVQTIIDQVETYNDLSYALNIIQKVNRRYQNRRYYQKRRLLLILCAITLLFLFLLK